MAANTIGGNGSGPTFTQVQQGVGLYRADGTPVEGGLVVYYAPLIGGSFPPTIDAATAWQSAKGVFFFAPASAAIGASQAQGVVNALARLLRPTESRQFLLWTSNPTAGDLGNPAYGGFLRSGDGGTFQNSAKLQFANLSLQIDSRVQVAADFAGAVPAIHLVPISNPEVSKLTLQQNQTGASLTLPADQPMVIPLAGTALGSWSFSLNPNAGDFYTLFWDGNLLPPPSAEFRYAFGGTSPTALRFPMLFGEVSLTDPTLQLPLVVVIDPVQPTLSSRTQFSFDFAKYGGAGNPILPTTQAFCTSAGRILELTPQEGAGFSLGLSPMAQGTGLYLTPMGRYQITLPAERTAAAAGGPPIAQGAIEVLCGIYGTEFLLMADQDYIEFVGSYPAHAPAFTPPGQQPTAAMRRAKLAVHGGDLPLDATFTANWAKVIPGPKTGKTFPALIKQSYCAQAANAVYYQADAASGYPFPIVVGVRLGDLSDPSVENAFPLAPYSYVFFNSPNYIVRGQPQEIDNPNPDIASGAVFEAFEAQTVSRARRMAIKLDRCLGPLFFDMGSLDALAGGYVQTPSGLIAGLNDGELNTDHPAGTYRDLLLARSPEFRESPPDPPGKNLGEWLRFKAGSTVLNECNGRGPFQVVSPFLSMAMMEAAPFIVISSKDNIGGFDNEIKLGEYTFQIDVSGTYAKEDGLGSNCVLVFKQAAGRSFWDLAQDVGSWSDGNVFVGDAATAARLSLQITAWMKDAEAKSKVAESAPYFVDLVTRLKDPEWTGMIALNVPLDYAALPSDVQMLLGGIRSQPLRGHHFGITFNKVKRGQNAFEALEKSSLFALIYYDDAFQAPVGNTWDYDFQCLQLKALFENSVIKKFNSRIAFSMRQLFADTVRMTSAIPHDYPKTKTIVIDGVLQVQDEVTRIVFATNDVRTFDFKPKTGSYYRVLDVQTTTHAGLDPVRPSTKQADGSIVLTSAFAMSGGLAFSKRGKYDLFSYALDKPLAYSGYAFEMTTKIVGNSASLSPITIQLKDFAIDASAAKPRDSSLLSSLPLKVEGFAFSTTEAGSNGIRVSGVGLDSADLQFAFSLKLVMGTLGELSDSGPLDGALMLGWTAGGDGKADQTGMLLVPPDKMAHGSFRLQGVIPSQYGDVKLMRPTVEDKPMYVLVLTKLNFWLGGLPLVLFGAINRSLTFFGKPDAKETGTAATKLSWILGEPLDDDSKAEIALPVPATTQAESEGPKLAITPALFVVAGMKVNVSTQSTSVIDDAMTKLSDFPLPTQKALEAIAKGENQDLNYDPSAGVTVGIALSITPITFTGVFSDPYIYGARIEIAKAHKKKNGGNGHALARAQDNGNDNGNGNGKGWRDVLGGLTIEIVYRKISSDLGVWSTSFTIPKTFEYGEAASPTKITIPTVGLAIYTNTDFRIDIGWPFRPAGGSIKPFAIDFMLGPFPVRFAAGLYLAKLRSADAPGVLGTDFAVIWRFGVGLAFGLYWSKTFGPAEVEAGIFAVLQFQGFLASKTGEPVNTGVDYWWFAGQIGLDLELGGSIDFKIISASIEVSATLYLNLALETAHSTVVDAVFDVEVHVSVKIVFVRFHFSWGMTIELFSTSFGSGPDAQLTGPTPGEHAPEMRLRAPPRAPIALTAIHPTVLAGLAGAAVASPIAITLHFALAPTSAASAPQFVATLLADTSDVPDGFRAIVQAMAQWLANGCDPSSLAAQLACMKAKLDNGTFESQIADFLSRSFVFTISPAPTADKDAAVIPMFPQLKLVYAGTDIRFDTPTLPDDYVKDLADYFNQLQRKKQARSGGLAALAGLPQSAAGVIASDIYLMVAKQLISQLQDYAKAHPNDNLAAALGALDYDGLAGFGSRFSMHGLRLPMPNKVPFGSQEQALYTLTGQQVQLAKTNGTWNTTVELAYGDETVKSWIKFSAGSSLSETLDQSFAMTDAIDTSWLDIRQLPPIRDVTEIFLIGESRNWTKAKATLDIRVFPDQLLQLLDDYFLNATAAAAEIVKVPNSPSGNAKQGGQPDFPAIDSTAVLFVPLTLAQIPGPDGKPLQDVYQLIGTDDQTRDRLDSLIDATGTDWSVIAADFLIATSSSQYMSPDSESGLVLAKTNLSTLSQPPRFLAELRAMGQAESPPPSSATLADVKAFVELVWELSVVHAPGFFVHVQNVPDGAFKNDNGRAQVALLLTFGSAAGRPALAPYHNAVIVNPAGLGKDNAPAARIYDQSGVAWTHAVSNYMAGRVGFSIDWQNPPQQPVLSVPVTPQQRHDYLQALYGLVQYRVEGLTAHPGLAHAAAVLSAPPLPSNWSLPVGPRDGDNKDGTSWHFVQTLPVAYFLGQQNRYAGIGATARFGVRVLDFFGNALPEVQPAPMPIVYNDKLVPASEWPATNVAYAFAPRPNNQVKLQLQFSFDPTSLPGTDANSLNQTRSLFALVYDQLTDPLQAGSANAGVEVETILAPAPLKVGTDGKSLHDHLIDFVGGIIAYIDGLLGKQSPSAPVPCTVDFALDRGYVVSLPSDIFQLTVALKFFRDPATIAPDILKRMPAVQWAISSLAPFADLAPIIQASGDAAPDPNFRAFAQAFETAWAGFDGADGQLKLGEGEPGTETVKKLAKRLLTGALERHDPDAASHRPLWCVRMGKTGGIDVTIPNAAGPSATAYPIFYAPKPLSTQLITRQVEVRQYKSAGDWNGTGADVILPDQQHTFTNIDMDVWGRAFTTAFDQMMAPQMATATATLDAGQYAALAASKESLADAIHEWLAPILMVPGQPVAPATAKERFRQALLTSLAANYTLSSVVEVPVKVALKGADQPAAFYGQVTPQVDIGLKDSFSLSPVKFKITSAENPVYLASVKHPEEQNFLALQPTLDVSFVEHDYELDRKHYGYVPSSWVSFVAPSFTPKSLGQDAPLSLAMGDNRVPIPLRVFPQSPAFQSQKAETAQNPSSIRAGLLWTYAVDVFTPDTGQDTLFVTFMLNDEVMAKLPPAPVRASLALVADDDDPTRPPPANLFEALARFAFEYPQMAPALADVPAAAFGSGNKAVAERALQRFASLVAGVETTWRTWANPALQSLRARARHLRAAAAATADLPGQHWSYEFDFSDIRDGKLKVTRSIQGSDAYPPWVDIDGFATPTDSGPTAVYTAGHGAPTPGETATYRLALSKLFLVNTQSAHASAEVKRNLNLADGAPAGTTVNEAFVYTTPIVTQKDPLVPYEAATNTITVGAHTATLRAAVDELLAPFLENPSPSPPAKQLRLNLDCQYIYTLSQAALSSPQTVASRLPTILARRELVLIGEAVGDEETIAAFKDDLVSALSTWRSHFHPRDVGASLKFGLTVTALISQTPLPLAYFSDVRIPVPPGNDGWWAK
jgi:hypothetical protein